MAMASTTRPQPPPQQQQEPPSGYYALRRGKSAQSCIFLFWEDCKQQVDGFADAEFSFYTSLKDASEYILSGRRREARTPPSLAVANISDVIPESHIGVAAGIARKGGGRSERSQARKLPTLARSKESERPRKAPPATKTASKKKSLTQPVADQSAKKHSNVAKSKKRPAQPTCTDQSKGKQSKKRSRNDTTTAAAEKEVQVVAVKKRKRNPTSKWKKFYETVKKHKEEHGDFDIPVENDDVRKWMQKQRLEYKLFKEGTPSSMYEEKVQLLEDIGFEFLSASEGGEGETRILKPPRKEWVAMLIRLKQYKAQHGTCVIPKGEEGHDDLRRWLKEQNQLYLRMRDGKQTSFTEEKAKILTDLGFVFEPTWSERIAEMRRLKEEHGSAFAVQDDDDSGLGLWIKNVRTQYRRCAQGKGSRLSKDQMDQLTELGFKEGAQGANNEAEDLRWNEMFEELKQYKEQNDTCLVPQSESSPLSRWVGAQRRDYRRLTDGKTSRLTALRLQKLNELGFSFAPNGNYVSFEERIEELRKYKQLFGHVRVTTNHPSLGNFVNMVRRQYKLFLEGKKSSMTEERRRQLADLGFVFQAGKTPVRTVSENKSWEERFQELLEFKELYGHTVVKQNSGRLGQWVHDQRKHYKLLKRGKSSKLSAEKALKLADIGFVFDAKQQKQGNFGYYSDGETA